MVHQTLQNTMHRAWPMILIFCVVIISVRISYLKQHHKKIIFYREIFSLIFIIYILLLYELVTNTERGNGGLNLIPFTEITRYELGSDLFIYNVIGNILVFVPFGFFVSQFINAKKVITISAITFISSLTIELVQYRIGRAFDVDDIILNIIGGIIGFLVYIALKAIQDHLPSIFKSDLFYNIISIIVSILLVFTFYKYIGFGWF